MGGGTESFPDLGEHCQYDDCNQLDFLPFTCNGCRKVFCLEHRTYRSHACPKADHSSRTVAVCDICSASIEKKANENDKDSLSRHEKSGTCDPSKKRKPRCPMPRCKEILTFSNQSTCKVCYLKVCLKHRFPSDHSCRMTKLAARTGLECKEKKQSVVLSSSIKAF